MLLLRLMNMKAKKKEIPWNLLLKDFKMESGEEDKELLQEWLQEGMNRDLYLVLKVIWFILLFNRSKINEKGSEDLMWKKMERRMQREKKPLFHKFSFSTSWVAAAVSLIIGFCMAYWLPRPQDSFLPTENAALYNYSKQSYTALNGKSKIVLPDGSSVWLNDGAELEYIENLDGAKREAYLKGEALFDVQKDPDRPFLVHVKDIQVKVYGTQFNVNSSEYDKNVKVALLNGSVEVNNATNHAMIQPGEMAVCSDQTGNIQVKETDVAFEAMWIKESLRIEQKSLPEVIRHLEKWYNVKIRLSGNIPTDQAYTFTIWKESIGEILSLIAKITPIHYEFKGEKYIVID